MLRVRPDCRPAVRFRSRFFPGAHREQRSACKGDYQKYCKGTTPAAAGLSPALSKSSDKLTAGCRKVLTGEAEKK